MLEPEYQYYRDNQVELYAKYADRFIVIVGDEVLGDYDSALDAYEATSETHEPGTFLIQFVTNDAEGDVQVFASRAIAFA